MNRKPYPRYKDSGIEWLGEVPEEWSIKPLKTLIGFVNGAAFSPNDWRDEGIPIIRIENLNGSEDFNCYIGDVDERYNVERGDLLYGWSGNKGTSFGPFIWKHVGRFYLNQHIFRILTRQLDPNWLYWSLKAVTAYIEEQTHGIIGLVHITKSEIGKVKVPYPLENNHCSIAAFLDRETARIDALIQKKERMIELLKEKRIALITQAVTKGLNPNAQMKDSGIEWLGEVPEHWNMTRLRYCIRLNPSKKEINHFPKDTEVSFLPMENVGEDGSLDLSETRAISEVDTGYTFFGENDVAIAKITPCFENGKGCVFRNLEYGYGFGSTELTVMRPITLIPDFLYFLTISTYFRKIGEALMQGSAGQKRVPDDYIRNLYIGLPTIVEQQQIVCYVHEKLRSNEALISLTSLSIDKLREYRTSIIHHAVTGKIDLRGYDAQTQ